MPEFLGALWAKRSPHCTNYLKWEVYSNSISSKLPLAPTLMVQFSLWFQMFALKETRTSRLKPRYFERYLLNHRNHNLDWPKKSWVDECFTISPDVFLGIFFQLFFTVLTWLFPWQVASTFTSDSLKFCLGGEVGSISSHKFDKLTLSHNLDNSLHSSPFPIHPYFGWHGLVW